MEDCNTVTVYGQFGTFYRPSGGSFILEALKDGSGGKVMWQGDQDKVQIAFFVFLFFLNGGWKCVTPYNIAVP